MMSVLRRRANFDSEMPELVNHAPQMTISKRQKRAGNRKLYDICPFVPDGSVMPKFGVVLGFRSFMVSKTSKPEKPEEKMKL